MTDRDSKTNNKWDLEILELNQLIVAGQIDSCRKRLDVVTPKSIPRKFSASVAQIANRVEYSLFALKILHPFIYPENTFQDHAENKEKLVYCHALLNLGAHQEAHELLDTIDAKQEVEVLFHKAMAFVSEWNYKKSIPLLKEYLKKKTAIEPYRRVILEVNLAAAYIAVSSLKEASELLLKIQASCQAANYQLLLGNSYELLAQVLFFRKDYTAALDCLAKGREILKSQPGVYLFYIEKWTGFCKAFQTGDVSFFKKLREQGLENNYFETVRDCDLFEAILKQDEALIRKVIMGTPSKHFRERSKILFQKTLKPQGTFTLELGKVAGEPTAIFDPQVKIGKEQNRLSETPRLLSLYEALTMDFYKPSYLGYLFKYVYPEEKFNPTTSPARVLSLLRRLDAWFKAAGLPLEVQFKKSEFALGSVVPMRILVRRGRKMTLLDSYFSEIKSEFGERHFSTAEVSKLLKISRASALRLLNQALKEKRIRPAGNSSQAAYQFLKKT